MTARWPCLLALLTVVFLAGCGGGSAPVVLTGNYFPLAIGTTWNYTTQLDAETPSDHFTTTGTMTRRLIGTQTITIGGDSFSTYVFQHDYTALDHTPDMPGPSSTAVLPFINYLFAATGGLASVQAYYRLVPGVPTLPTHLELVAMSRVGGPIVPMGDPRPILFNPPFHGTERAASLWFTPMPLMPSQTDMSSIEEHDKVLNYGIVGGVGGQANAVISINYFGANLHVNNALAAISGRGRTFYKQDVGLWAGVEQSDWYATVNVAGYTSLVTARLELQSVTP